MSVLGYITCPCGIPVLDVVAYKTDGHCEDCHRENVNNRISDMEIVGRNLRVTVPAQLPTSEAELRKRAAKRKARKTPESRHNEKLREAAKQAAFKRLRDLFPELFEVLVADERAKRGLKPWTITAALTPGTAETTLTFLEDYAQRRDDSGAR